MRTSASSSSHGRRVLALVAGVIAVGGAGCANRQAKRDADAGELRMSLARVLIDHRDYDQAVAPLRDVTRRHPENAEAHALLGIVYRERGMYDAAEDELKRAAELAPRFGGPRSDLGITLDLAGKHDAALVEHRRAVELQPNFAAYRNNLGYSLLLAGRIPESIEVLRAALRIDPSSRRIRHNLAFAVGRSGDVETAAREFANSGTPAQAANNIGFVFESLGDNKNACVQYDSAVALDETLDTAKENRARVCPASLVARSTSTEPTSPISKAPKEGTP